MYLKAFKDSAVYKYFFSWMRSNDPYRYSDENIILNNYNEEAVKIFLKEEGINAKSIDYDERSIYANLYKVDEKDAAKLKDKIRKNTRLDDFLTPD